jgi:catechol 2,3-dioxygenase-like lactoylglutathione lyase family enzyme
MLRRDLGRVHLARMAVLAAFWLMVGCTSATPAGSASSGPTGSPSGDQASRGGNVASQRPPAEPGPPGPIGEVEEEDRALEQVPRSSSTSTVDTSKPTAPAAKDAPPPGAKEVNFATYVSSGNPSGNQLMSDSVPDISGADSEIGVALHTGNRYIDVVDGGVVTRYDPTSVFPGPLVGGLCCDQVMTYVPKIDKFVWYMQHWKDGSGTGGFRLATASPFQVRQNFQTAWTYWDFAAGYFGFTGVWFDFPDLAFTDKYLVGTTNVVSKGRMVFRIDLDALKTGGTINADYTDPATSPVSMFHYSHLVQHGQSGAFWAGHKDTATIRIFSWPDASSGYSYVDVGVANWPNFSYSSVGPDGTDWFDPPWADDEVSGGARKGNELWLAWTATAGKGTPNGFDFPNVHARVATIDLSTWQTISEMQVWNPDYAFAFPFLDTNSQGEVGIIVGWGGQSDHANTAEGIIGDYVVWYHNGSTKTPDRFGDYITIRRSGGNGGQFAAFGYYTVKDPTLPSGYLFTPYYSLFSH